MFNYLFNILFLLVLSVPVYSLDEEVSYLNENTNISIAGILTLPESSNVPFPAIVLIAGSGQTNRNTGEPFELLAKRFSKLGIAVLRYDKRGTGASTGDYLSATTKDLADDVEAGIKFLRSREDINPKKIGLFGHSEGGLIASMIAASNKEIAFLILFATPALNMLKLAELRKISMFNKLKELSILTEQDAENYKELDKKITEEILKNKNISDGDALEEAKKLATVFFKNKGKTQDEANLESKDFLSEYETNTSFIWSRFMLNVYPANYLKKITTPILVVYGEFDSLVLPHLNLPIATKALEESGNQNVTIMTVEGIGHQYSEITEFIDNFKPKEPNEKLLTIFDDWLVKTK